MNHYNRGDKLKCIASVNSTYFEVCNPAFDIEPGTIVEVNDLEDYESSSWYYLEEANKKFGISAWNDNDDPHIDNFFTKIN